jgi:hypothetical protein
MGEATIRLDDEVVELLGEIAKDPRSTLFGATPRRVVTSAMGGLPRLSAEAAGWTPAERHLIRAHREQLAYWLGCLAIEMSRKDPAVASMMVDTLTVRVAGAQEKLRRLSASDLAQHLEPRDREVLAALDLLRPGTEYTQITSLARKLRPNEASENLHGWSLLIEGANDSARQLLGTLLQESARSATRYFAAINLNYAHYALGSMPKALEAQLAAITESPEPNLLGSTMLNAATLGDWSLARVCSAWLDDLAHAEHPAILQLCRIVGSRDLVSDDRTSIRRLSDFGGHVARRICDAALG